MVYKMGIQCESSRKYQQALEHFIRFLELVQEEGTSLDLSLAYNHLGLNYYNLGGNNNLQLAIEYHGKHKDTTTQGYGID
jgi:hypothetical protein